MTTRQLHKLSPTQIKAKNMAPGDHSDGGNLYLRVLPSGSRSWVFRFRFGVKEHELGLGSARDVSLADARVKAAEFRGIKANGKNPAEAKPKAVRPTLGAVYAEYVEQFTRPLLDLKAEATWQRTARQLPKLMAMHIDTVTAEDIHCAIRGMWTEKNETATRSLQRLEKVFNYAKTRGLFVGENPAAYRGNLQFTLPRIRREVKHHRSLSADETLIFLAELSRVSAMTAKALEFVILTAARTGEVIKARWEDIDLKAGVWTRPASVMKAKKQHRVPLSKEAIGLLLEIGPQEAGWVFGWEMPLSNMAMLQLIKRMGWKERTTVHGFRSTFKDWAQQNGYDHIQTEMCLAHNVLTSTEAAYWRDDMLEQRRRIMADWSQFVFKRPQNISQFSKRYAA